MEACVDEDTALALLEGGLDDAAVLAIDAHVDGCPECLELIAELARSDVAHARDAPRERPARGMALGRYVLLRLVGVGAMGAVYAAYDPELDRKVALKLLRPAGDGVSAREALLREARAMARLNHPNVVTVFDIGSFDAGVFLSMELVEGMTLGAWLAARDRSTAAVLSVFVDAGRGLAAAHAAGIVHRDFKPDNVLVEDARRVVVTDFGLAAAADVESAEIAGTPVYMAPEQRRGTRSVDARSDQYSFCVALREALSARRLSPRIDRAIARGLSEDPRDRFPTIDALLAELERPPSPTAKRVALGALGLAATCGVAWLALRQDIQRRAECRGRATAIAATWSGDEKSAARRALGADATPSGEEAWSRVDRALDRYVGATRSLNDALCRDPSPSNVHALRAACLDARIEEARDFVGVLAKGDAKSASRAMPAALTLTPVEACSDVPRLLRGDDVSSDASANRSLVLAKVLGESGRYAEGAKIAEDVATASRARGDRRGEALALYRWGDMSISIGDGAGAEARLGRAEHVAESAGADRTRAHALAALIFVTGYLLHDRSRALALNERLEAVLERIGGDDDIEAHRLLALGMAENDAGRYEAADALLTRAVDVAASASGKKTREVAMALNNLGLVADARGDHARARRCFEEALAIWVDVLGAHHPDVALPLNNLGMVAHGEGHDDDALVWYRKALAVAEASLGPEHPTVAAILDSIGEIETLRGNGRAAISLHLRALAILERAFGERSADTTEPLVRLAAAELSVGDRARAIEAARRAEATFGAGTPSDLKAAAKDVLARAAEARP